MGENILDELESAIETTLAKGITDRSLSQARKSIRDLADSLLDDFEYRVKEDLAPLLSGFVKQMATHVVTELLAGNESEMRRYLGCEVQGWNERSDGAQGWGRKKEIWEWHPVIHGKLFEHGAMTLRRDIVEVHRDLITNERIKDLEDQNRSLVEQVNRERAEKERAQERLRDYRV
jgi:cytochrome P450